MVSDYGELLRGLGKLVVLAPGPGSLGQGGAGDAELGLELEL